VLITGAAGVLGKAVTGLLANEPGIELRLTDVLPVTTPYEFRAVDLTDAEQLKPLCAGVDVVLHIAALHPWKPYTTEQYLRCNVEATYKLLEAAAAAGVCRVIYTSSVAAMGLNGAETVPLPWDESKPCTPGDLYSLTKRMGEEMCEMFAAQRKLTYIALRPGMFIPVAEDDPQYGFGLLSFSVHGSDVAAAHVLALRSKLANEAFVITARTLFTREDAAELGRDAKAVILRRYPRAERLLAQGLKLPERLAITYDISKAHRLLGYEPQHTFATWLERRLQHES
jgi:nucleoside-diphosphate-sugar epimerase